MNLIIFKIIFLQACKCLITKEMIAEVNRIVFTDSELECSIINPFFGYIFPTKMLYNLRNYYYKITPHYRGGVVRDYTNDKATDSLSFVLINLFSLLEEGIVTTTLETSNNLKNYFLDYEMRSHCINSFGILFANIAKYGGNSNVFDLSIDEINGDASIKDLRFNCDVLNFFINANRCYNDKELLSLVLLLIHSFVLDIIDNAEEYQLYVTTIVNNINTDTILHEGSLVEEKTQHNETSKLLNIYLLHELYSQNPDVTNLKIFNIFSNNYKTLSPIDYFVAEYIYDLTGKKLNYKRSHLDFLYKSEYLVYSEQKEEYLYNIFTEIKKHTISYDIIKITEMIIKSEKPTNDDARKRFLPFFIACFDLKKIKISLIEKLDSWQEVIKRYENLEYDNYLMTIWNEEITNNYLSEDYVICHEMSYKSLLKACTVLKNSSIKYLRIRTKVGEIYEWTEIFNALGGCLYLRNVDIRSEDFNFEDRLKYYQFVIDNINKINIIGIRYQNITIEDIKIIAEIIRIKNNQITVLDLEKNNLKRDSIKILMDALKHENNRVIYLYLDDNNIGPKGTKHICDTLKNVNNQVKLLDLSNNGIGNQGAKYLSDALTHRNNKIKQLDLKMNTKTDLGAKYIFNVLSNPDCKVKSLDISCNDLQQDSSFIVAALRNEHCQLYRLYLSWCNLGQKEIEEIKKSTGTINNTILIDLAVQ